MSEIAPGKIAPGFTIPGLNGQRYSLADALKKGPVLAAFFKVSCPVCQFTFPFLERLFESYGDGKVSFWAISQDNKRDTKEFLDEFGIRFPAMMDGNGYPVSNQYGLTIVPSVFLIRPDGKVAASSIGFSKADLEKMAAEIARACGKSTEPLFRRGEVVPDFKPG